MALDMALLCWASSRKCKDRS